MLSHDITCISLPAQCLSANIGFHKAVDIQCVPLTTEPLIFFDATVTTASYMEIFNTFVNQLDDEELSIGYFQQDGATSHTSHTSMAEIQSFFGDRIISKGL